MINFQNLLYIEMFTYLIHRFKIDLNKPTDLKCISLSENSFPISIYMSKIHLQIIFYTLRKIVKTIIKTKKQICNEKHFTLSMLFNGFISPPQY